MEAYTDDFYRSCQGFSQQSAREVVPIVLQFIQPQRIVDVGCGTGAWLSVFREHGIEDILGIDGDYVNRDMLQIPAGKFMAFDLAQPLPIQEPFDLVVSLEVAEHLPPEAAETFVTSLTGLGSVILFSAAIPYQGGVNHVNEQWPEYWAALFQAKGYVPIDCIRNKIWQNPTIDWWYAQNTLIFAQQNCLDNYPLLKQVFESINVAPLAMVHPNSYLSKIHSFQKYLEEIDQELSSAWLEEKLEAES